MTRKLINKESSRLSPVVRLGACYAAKVRETTASWLILLVIAASLPGSANPVSSLVQTVGKGVDVDRAMDTMRRVYDTDHFFTFPKFEQTAVYLK